MRTTYPERVTQRAATRYTVNQAGCWETTYAIHRDGYGHIGWSEDNRIPCTQVHRAAWVFHNGPIPGGMQLDHLCGNRRCVNPQHLEAVTPRENTYRAMGLVMGDDGKSTHCRSGHAYTHANTYWARGVRYCRACRGLREVA